MPGWRLPASTGSKPFKLTALGLSLVLVLTLGLVGSGVFSRGGAPAGPVVPPVLAGHAAVRTPRQLVGTAAGRSHLVPASVTAAEGTARSWGPAAPGCPAAAAGEDHRLQPADEQAASCLGRARIRPGVPERR